MDAKEALKHWAAWSRDTGKIYPTYAPTCTSFERNFVKDPSRYGWPVDQEERFKYDLKTAEKVEGKLIKCLSKTELMVILCCEVYAPGRLSYEVIARRLHMTKEALDSYRLAALHKFGRNWHG